MCDKVVSKDPFMLKYYLNRYKTQEMCKVVSDFLPALKFVPDCFFPMIKTLGDDLHSNYNIIFVTASSNYVTIFIVEMSILSVDLNNINLDDVSYMNMM